MRFRPRRPDHRRRSRHRPRPPRCGWPAKGAAVAVVDRDAEPAQAVVRDAGRTGVALAADIAADDAGPRLVERKPRRSGRCDVLVNNAAHTTQVELAPPSPRTGIRARGDPARGLADGPGGAAGHGGARQGGDRQRCLGQRRHGLRQPRLQRCQGWAFEPHPLDRGRNAPMACAATPSAPARSAPSIRAGRRAAGARPSDLREAGPLVSGRPGRHARGHRRCVAFLAADEAASSTAPTWWPTAA